MKFKANENLFKVGDNWVCVSGEEIHPEDLYLHHGKAIKTCSDKPYENAKALETERRLHKVLHRKILFSTQHIDDSIPVLDGDTQPKEIEMIEVEMEDYRENGYSAPYKLEPITLPNGKVKCKITYK